MKKKNLQTLRLNKKSISNLKNVKGGNFYTYKDTNSDCHPLYTLLTFDEYCLIETYSVVECEF